MVDKEIILPEAIAAIDLGSNSFHMVVAAPRDGRLQPIDRIQEMVRIAAGLDAENRLTPEAMARGIECLARFARRLRNMPHDTVRAVGTSTLRNALNAEEFLAAAEPVLGYPIEIISGLEEARLIYQGVAHGLPQDGRRRLVMDIGGGSTELIIGEGLEPLHMESTMVGCVTVSAAHFPGGAITRKGILGAELSALMQLEPYQALYRTLGWEEAVGTSGTIRAVNRVIREAGWGDDGITPAGLKRLVDALLEAGHLERLKLPGLSDKRTPVFPGGVMILLAAFEALGIERMRVADGAMREGILYDIIGRLRHEDVRARAVAAFAGRLGVDQVQAARVEKTALYALDQVAAAWGLATETSRLTLRWAALLHEAGLAVSRYGYHKHGAYILENADLQGFSRQDQITLSALVRAHRRKFPAPLFKKLTDRKGPSLLRLALLLRLAATLHRGRGGEALPRFALTAKGDSLQLRFPGGWLDDHPLTRADLEQEAEWMRVSGVRLEFS